MHPKFLHLLCCPESGESFTLQAEQTRANGMVVCPDAARSQQHRRAV